MFNKKRLASVLLAGALIILITSIAFVKSSKGNMVETISSNKNKTVLAFTTYYYPEDKSSYNKMVDKDGKSIAGKFNEYFKF